MYNFKSRNIIIRNVKVYGLEESVVASGYPMSLSTPSGGYFDLRCMDVGDSLVEGNNTQDITRAENLGEAKQGSGHDCYLKGIIVQADFMLPQYMHQQTKRYSWFDYVSSQSTMHKITQMDIRDNCNDYVDPQVIKIVEGYVEAYNKEHDPEIKSELFQYIISNIPSGFFLTARITTNYLQLKTMYNQRKNHKLMEWRDFCKWCEGLPHFLDFTQRVGK